MKNVVNGVVPLGKTLELNKAQGYVLEGTIKFLKMKDFGNIKFLSKTGMSKIRL